MTTESRRLRVVVIGGGENCEHAVSVASAAAVTRAMDSGRYEVIALTIGRDGTWLHADQTPVDGGLAGAIAAIQASDLVFPAVHGPRGEDGALAALCEVAGTPYVGAGVRAGAIAMDKWVTKLVADALGIATAHGTLLTTPSIPVRQRFPAVVKPVAAGSSHGVARVNDMGQLRRAIANAFAYDDRVLVEDLIGGREIDIAVVDAGEDGLLVGPPLEIRLPAGAVFDTERKYDGSAEFDVPADIGATARAQLERAARSLFESLQCQGLARFDFFLTDEGPVLNEVNTMPGMTEQSQLPKMFAAAGLPYPALIDLLIEQALRRSSTR